MNIGIVCYPTYGGSGVLATELGAELAAKGHKVHIISSSAPFRLSRLPVGGSLYLHEVPRAEYPLFSSELFTLSLAAKIRQVALDEKLDIIHAHYAIPHAASALLAHEMLKDELGRALPYVVTLHGTDITLVGQSFSFRNVVRFTLRKADAITAVSKWLRAETDKHFDPERPIEVIYNFIDTDRFQKRDRTPCKAKFAPNGEKVVLHISNFRKVKRVPDVVRIFAAMGQETPSKLLLIGDGPEREMAMQVAREEGVLERTWFLGKQDDIEAYLNCADLFLFPSDHESFGLAALEAMSSEVPVIASHAGGLPEVIDDGETGFLRKPNDTVGMAEMGRRLLADDALRAQIGERARASVLSRFRTESIVASYENLYEQVLREAPTPRLADHSLSTNGEGQATSPKVLSA